MEPKIKENMKKRVRLFAIFGILAYCIFGMLYLPSAIFCFADDLSFETEFAIIGLVGGIFVEFVRFIIRIGIFIILMHKDKRKENKITNEILAFVLLNLNILSISKRIGLIYVIFDSFDNGRGGVDLSLCVPVGIMFFISIVFETLSYIFFVLATVISIRIKNNKMKNPVGFTIAALAVNILFIVTFVATTLLLLQSSGDLHNTSMFGYSTPLFLDTTVMIVKAFIMLIVCAVLWVQSKERKKIWFEAISLVVLSLSAVPYAISDLLIKWENDLSSFEYHILLDRYSELYSVVYNLETVSFILIVIAIAISIINKVWGSDSGKTDIIAEYPEDEERLS